MEEKSKVDGVELTVAGLKKIFATKNALDRRYTLEICMTQLTSFNI